MKDYLIAPSILSADFARLGDEVSDVLDAGADVIHFDVMDNHYVPNLTVGPMVCQALRNHGIEAPIDVHLMVTPVDQLIVDFAKAGETWLHVDAAKMVCVLLLDRVLDLHSALERTDQLTDRTLAAGFGGLVGQLPPLRLARLPEILSLVRRLR